MQILVIIFSFNLKKGLNKKNTNGLSMNYSYYNNEHSLCYTKFDGFSGSFPFQVPFVNIMNIHFKITCISN